MRNSKTSGIGLINRETIKRIKRLKYEDMPVKLFFRFLDNSDLAERVLGKRKWGRFLDNWEKSDDSLEKARVLEEQKRTILPYMKAKKAEAAVKFLVLNPGDEKAEQFLTEVRLPWYGDVETTVKELVKFAKKNAAIFENNNIQLQNTLKEQENKHKGNEFSLDDSISALNLGGFSIPDPSKLTIGPFISMNRTIQKHGRKQT